MKPSDGYICCIVNPKSGSRSSDLHSQPFEKYLKSKGFEVRVKLTNSLEHACELSTDAAVDHNCAVVVAIGGDGTVREIAHGLEGSDKPLLIIPSGTENLLANELGFDEKLQTVIEAFESGDIRHLDLGSINGKCFTSVVGFGFDGDVVERVSSLRQGHIDHLTYFWPIWRTFWDYKYRCIKVEIDGQEVFNEPGLVFVGNISRYALGLGILKQADFSDGLLDVCIYKCASRLYLIKHSLLTILKQHNKSSDVIYCKAKHITVSSEAPDIKSEIDGDPGPALPAEIKIIPQAVNVMVPKDAKPAGLRARILRMLK